MSLTSLFQRQFFFRRWLPYASLMEKSAAKFSQFSRSPRQISISISRARKKQFRLNIDFAFAQISLLARFSCVKLTLKVDSPRKLFFFSSRNNKNLLNGNMSECSEASSLLRRIFRVFFFFLLIFYFLPLMRGAYCIRHWKKTLRCLFYDCFLFYFHT